MTVEENKLGSWFSRQNLMLIGLVLITLISCVLFVFLANKLFGFNDKETESDRATPTPFAQTTFPKQEESLIVGISGSQVVTVTADQPVLLSWDDVSFSIVPQQLNPTGVWAGTGNSSEASWVYGTVVNYIIGIEDNEENRQHVEKLLSGDKIQITTNKKQIYTFEFLSREKVSATDEDLFTQNKPGLTLVMLGAKGNERLVLRAEYIADITESTVVSALTVGETAELNNLEFSPLQATYLPVQVGTLPGFSFFVVDYQIQNLGQTPFDTDLLRFRFSDEFGNQYVINPVATQLANYSVLPELIQAGEIIQASWGYQIPSRLSDISMNFSVSRVDTGAELETVIYMEDSSRLANQASLDVQSAEISLDGTTVTIGGGVTNLGSQTLIVESADVLLQSGSSSIHQILVSNPGFPWIVGPGQTVLFGITFQRPQTETAIFSVLNHPFELSGLR